MHAAQCSVPEQPDDKRTEEEALARDLDRLSERFLGSVAAPSPEAPVACDADCLWAAAKVLSESPADPQSALEAVVTVARVAAEADVARLYLADSEGLLHMRAGRSRWENLPFLALVLRLEAGILERILHSDGPVLMTESFEISQPAPMAAREMAYCLALPLRARAKASGVLLMFRGEPFGEGAGESLRRASSGLGLIIDYLGLLARGAGGQDSREAG